MSERREVRSKVYLLQIGPGEFQLTRKNVAKTCFGAVLAAFASIALIFGGVMLVFGIISSEWAAASMGLVFSLLSGWVMIRTVAASETWTASASTNELHHVVEMLGRVTRQRAWSVPSDAEIRVSGDRKGIFGVHVTWEDQTVQVLTTNDHAFIEETARALSDVLEIPAEGLHNVSD